jgi:hypothetical protein
MSSGKFSVFVVGKNEEQKCILPKQLRLGEPLNYKVVSGVNVERTCHQLYQPKSHLVLVFLHHVVDLWKKKKKSLLGIIFKN